MLTALPEYFFELGAMAGAIASLGGQSRLARWKYSGSTVASLVPKTEFVSCFGPCAPLFRNGMLKFTAPSHSVTSPLQLHGMMRRLISGSEGKLS